MSSSRTGRTARLARNSPGGGPGSLPLDQIYPLHPGEWVLVKAVECDERQNIVRAEILAHSTSRKRVSEALIQAHRDDPSVRTYLFPGGQHAASPEEWREQLAEAARDPLNAGW